MVASDIPAGLALCRASRWNQTEADWRAFLATEPPGAIVAAEHGHVVGTAATFPYGPFTWISMVLVDPAARGRGVGTALLEEVLMLVPPGSVARLDATPLGEPIYRRLGFTPEYSLSRWVREKGDGFNFSPSCEIEPVPAFPSNFSPSCEIEPVPAFPSQMLDLDVAVFGASRRVLLERLAAGAPELARVCAEQGELRGYVFGRPGHVRHHIGPLVADSIETATRLLDACLGALAGRSVLIDAPDAQAAWRETLAARGFEIERSFLRMSRGALTTSGAPSRLFAVTGPEFG